ncbi:baculoviral IAP repeat-containing protein 5 [Chelonus insularis]|uniref:baculoviral IAP repeat-containing protein 5 n=1 Tax=Chelonus insularis TaxID=460826 RepID=UPI00158AAFBA|nr:baculoviral IAP repeat-containing protein 5 [Chelonus insularis]
MGTSRNMDLISEDSFFWSKNRIKTFTYWPFQDSTLPCNPKQMAAAGFIAIGGSQEPDLVECIFCYKKLDGWESSDDPWIEHSRHQNKCPFIALNKKDEMTWTVEELFILTKQYIVEKYIHANKKKRESLIKNFVEDKENVLASMKITSSKKRNL